MPSLPLYINTIYIIMNAKLTVIIITMMSINTSVIKIVKSDYQTAHTIEVSSAWKPLFISSVSHPQEKPKYWFDWAVNDHYSGNEYNMQEHRDGEKTEGFYNVLLPDTRVQRVSYTVDGDSGFVAEVTYEGEAKEPTNRQTYLPPTPPTPPPSIYDVPH